MLEFEQSLCPGCGQPRHLSMDKDLQQHWKAELPVRCHACTAQLQQAKGYAENEMPQALHFPVTLNRPPQAGE